MITNRGGWPYGHPPSAQFTLNTRSPLSRKLVHWWLPIDSHRTLALRDFIGRNHCIFPVGSATPSWATTGRGPALSFDGGSDYVPLTSSPTAGKSELTLSMWINPDEWVSTNTLWDEWYSANSWQFSILEGSWYTRDASTGTSGARNNDLALPTVQTGQWSQLVFVYSVSRALKAIYLNGQLTGSTSTSVDALTSGRNGFRIAYPSDGTYYDGLMGDIAFFDYALSDAEVKEHYQNQWGLYAPIISRVWYVPVSGSFFQAESGTLSSTGALGRKTAKSFAGATSPTGALNRKTSTSHAGALTSAGAMILKTLKTYTGVITSSGALGRTISRTAAGALTTAGALGRKITTSHAGALTSSGALSSLKDLLYNAVSGVLSFSGALGRKTAKIYTGTITPAGTLGRAISTAHSGVLSATGTLNRLTKMAISGALSFAGTLGRKMSLTHSGSVAPSGALSSIIGIIQNAVAGVLSFAGSLNRNTYVTHTGAITPTGLLGRAIKIAHAGMVSLAGALSTALSGAIIGIVNLTLNSRDFGLSLKSRTFDLALKARDFALMLKNK